MLGDITVASKKLPFYFCSLKPRTKTQKIKWIKRTNCLSSNTGVQLSVDTHHLADSFSRHIQNILIDRLFRIGKVDRPLECRRILYPE